MTATVEQMTGAVETYVASYNEADLDGIVSIFADNATVEDPVGSSVLHGNAAIREFMSAGVGMGAKLRLLGAIRCVSDTAAFPFAVELEMDGVAKRIEVIDIFRFDDDGKVTEMRAVWGPQNMVDA